MPFYEYECEDGHKFTNKYDIGKAPNKVKCECGKASARVVSMPAIRIPSPASEARKGRGGTA